MLYIIGTPIGNLGDISHRVMETIKNCDIIYAEDTRQSGKLLSHLEIKKPLHRYDEHNKETASQEIIRHLIAGENIGLMTDAGMPAISDPGQDIIRICIENNLQFEVIQGPTAFVHALIASGLDTRTFTFCGFLERKKSNATSTLQSLSKHKSTLIFYEAPHRLISTLSLLEEVLGDRNCSVSRELTKLHEEHRRGKLSAVIDHFENTDLRGEFVICVSGYEEARIELTDNEILSVLQEEMKSYDKKTAISTVAKKYKIPKNHVYKLAHNNRY